MIPCRNDARYLERCLGLLTRQSVPPGEVVVVDNASGDDTTAVARRFGARVVREPVVGIWAAASTGYDAAAGELILRLDADSRPGPGWVAHARAAFAADPRLDFLTGDAWFYGASGLVNALGEHCYVGAMYFWLTPYFGHPPVFGSTFAMRRAAWRRVRDRVHSECQDIHDDFDLGFAIRADMRVRRDRTWRVGVSARPLQSWSGLRRRLYWAYTTARANGRLGGVDARAGYRPR